MSRIPALLGVMLIAPALAGGLAPGARAQLVPQAGSAGAGSSAISGIPIGPANPAVLSDPSGIGNAGRLPPLGSNAPAPPTFYGSLTSQPPQPSRSRVVTPAYTGGSPRFSARNVESGKPSARRRGRTRASSFTGICRGC